MHHAGPDDLGRQMCTGLKKPLKIFLVTAMLLSFSQLSSAQSASLRFDEKWDFLKAKNWKTDSFKTSLQQKNPMREVPRSWCYSELALFCKLEVKMEKAARFPVKFRLGDVQYVDRLEGKIR